jgi:hypothetical protein
MGLEIFNNDKNYVFKNDKNTEKIDLIKVQNNDKVNLEEVKPKVTRKQKVKITKENQDFINYLKSGSGFKIIPKASD